MSSFSSFIRSVFARDHSKSFSHAEQELLDALGESRDLLNVAAAQAERIISDANVLSNKLQKDVEERILGATGKVEETLTDFTNQIVEQGKLAQKYVAESVKRDVSEQSQQLRTQLLETVRTYQDQLQAEIRASQKATKKDLQKFTEQEHRRIARVLIEKLPEVVRDVTRQSISMRDHEKLIQDGLGRIAEEIRISYEG